MSAGSLSLPRDFVASPNPTPQPEYAPPVSYAPDQSTRSDDLHSSDALPPSDVSDAQSDYRHEVSTIRGVQEEDLVSDEDRPSYISESQRTTSGADPREPTRDSEATPRQTYGSDRAIPIPESSPVPSGIFTPTPAFQPRPRARFQVPTPTFTSKQPMSTTPPDREVTDEEDATDNHTPPREDLDPTTPYSHKRSFLMDVINSTARPRPKFPTPPPPPGQDSRYTDAWRWPILFLPIYSGDPRSCPSCCSTHKCLCRGHVSSQGRFQFPSSVIASPSPGMDGRHRHRIRCQARIPVRFAWV